MLVRCVRREEPKAKAEYIPLYLRLKPLRRGGATTKYGGANIREPASIFSTLHLLVHILVVSFIRHHVCGGERAERSSKKSPKTRQARNDKRSTFDVPSKVGVCAVALLGELRRVRDRVGRLRVEQTEEEEGAQCPAQ